MGQMIDEPRENFRNRQKWARNFWYLGHVDRRRSKIIKKGTLGLINFFLISHGFFQTNLFFIDRVWSDNGPLVWGWPGPGTSRPEFGSDADFPQERLQQKSPDSWPCRMNRGYWSRTQGWLGLPKILWGLIDLPTGEQCLNFVSKWENMISSPYPLGF